MERNLDTPLLMLASEGTPHIVPAGLEPSAIPVNIEAGERCKVLALWFTWKAPDQNFRHATNVRFYLN